MIFNPSTSNQDFGAKPEGGKLHLLNFIFVLYLNNTLLMRRSRDSDSLQIINLVTFLNTILFKITERSYLTLFILMSDSFNSFVLIGCQKFGLDLRTKLE